jgi:hypothetical protein
MRDWFLEVLEGFAVRKGVLGSLDLLELNDTECD